MNEYISVDIRIVVILCGYNLKIEAAQPPQF